MNDRHAMAKPTASTERTQPELPRVLSRRPECEIAPYVYAGVQLVHPRLFKGAPDGAFSFNVLYDKAIETGRLHSMVHDGEWFHIGTAEGLAEADKYMQVRYPGDKKRG